MNGVLLSACDRAMAEAPCAVRSHAGDRPRLIIATTILASSLAFIDGSVVNVGLPAIGRSLGAGGTGLTWIVNGYLLPLTALLLLGGAAGDRFGRRPRAAARGRHFRARLAAVRAGRQRRLRWWPGGCCRDAARHC